MRIVSHRPSSGIALIMVMMVIVVLGVLAGGFAAAMQVEARLARNGRFESDLEWIGRSGVEFARYVLAEQVSVANEPWDSLNQKWAGGPVGTNEILAALSLNDNPLGPGSFSVKIVDLERKFNINQISEGNSFILRRALELSGAEHVDFTAINDAFLDWKDPDDMPHLSGAESSDYLNMPNPGFTPYLAKNGPLDEPTELLRIRGITPELFWGGSGKPGRHSFKQEVKPGTSEQFRGGLVNLFTTLSRGAVNINTASAEVLQLIPGIDETTAQAIIAARSGLDGVDGTEDDVPFRSVDELMNLPGMVPQLVQQIRNFLTPRSSTFEVVVEAKIGEQRREFSALLLRPSPSNLRDIQTYFFHWN